MSTTTVESNAAALELVTEAFAHFERSRKKERAALIAARDCGAKLIKANSLCKHGEWLPLLNSIFKRSTRLAQLYMQIARHWELCEEATTITEALAMLPVAKKPQPTSTASEMLQACELVVPGLSYKEIIEQSSCFAFKDGRVITYNDEISCSAPCEFAKDVECAVQAEPLRQVLKAAGDRIKRVKMGVEDLRLSGGGFKAGVRMEDVIQLPIDEVNPPTKWRVLPAGFDEAVTLTVHCISTDPTEFVNTCVHFHPEWTEACDNFQVLRHDFSLGLKRPTMVRGVSIRNMVGHRFNEFSLAEGWLHFRNPDGLIMSCRRWTDEYPDYTSFIKTKGKPLTLNSGVAAAARHAEIFSRENADENQVLVELKRGKLRITGRGAVGWLQEIRPVEYKGKALSFNVSPSILRDLIKRSGDDAQCIVAPGALKVVGPDWQYVACLGEVKEDPEA